MTTFLSKQKYQILFLVLVGAYFLFNGFLPRPSKTLTDNAETTQKTIIWNDDEESIPKDGEKVVIEFTRNDTIYIGSVEANQ